MNRQVPTLGKLLTMVLFALSCFTLTLWLWIQFGGAVPFKAEGYRITTTVPEATSLAVEADVRIAGVRIGRVKEVVPGQNGRAKVQFEVESRFAPVQKGTTAILRQKTLLGEAYISLTPPAKETNNTIPEGGAIPDSDVGTTTELDEFFSIFDEPTRAAFQTWMQDGGKGLEGQGGNFGRSIVELQLLVTELGDFTKTLNEQQPSLKSGLRDGRTVLQAVSRQRGALESAITETNQLFKATGDQDAALTAFVEKAPRLLAATRDGTAALEGFAERTAPVAERLRPTAKAFGPAAEALADVSPELRQLLVGVERVNKNSIKGLPATEQALRNLPLMLDGLDPFLAELNPIIRYAGYYSDPLWGSVGNLAAVTNSSISGGTAPPRDGRSRRFLRGALTIQSSSLAAAPNRFSTDQANAYRRPNWATRIGQGLPYAYSEQSCGRVVPRIPDTTNDTLNAPESAASTNYGWPDVSLIDSVRYSLFDQFGYYTATPDTVNDTTPQRTPAPTTPDTAPRVCEVDQQFNTTGTLTTYPQLPADPNGTTAGRPAP